MKVINNSTDKEEDQRLVEKATEIITNSIEGKLDKSVYIKHYSIIQDDVSDVSLD